MDQSNVAPRAGAWIETSFTGGFRHDDSVAPRAGAWIETFKYRSDQSDKRSLPVRERGLKRIYVIKVFDTLSVAPRAGAWIETCFGTNLACIILSLPVRERGLKQSVRCK